jgi:hypothetical protein
MLLLAIEDDFVQGELMEIIELPIEFEFNGQKNRIFPSVADCIYVIEHQKLKFRD